MKLLNSSNSAPSQRTRRIGKKMAPDKMTQSVANEDDQERTLFPVVAIGASAGGLNALENFLKQVPAESGLAYVIIQHQSPDHKGILTELLQRATPMPVSQVTDAMRVAPNRVYLIPPNKDMSIFGGALHLFDPVTPRGLRLPIDFFFRSLADDFHEYSIGVLLSGMGSDGTLGLRAIKDKAGLCLAQEPATAQFDGMPRSAIEAGVVDLVAPAGELPGKILSYVNNPRLMPRNESFAKVKEQDDMGKIFVLLRMKTGQDFSLYKKNTICRRIERRMALHQIDRISVYVRFLQENPHEIELLFKDLLIGVTSFFRDPTVWEQLKAEAIPRLLKERTGGQALRAWVPGCSTGEEAYSLAIVFKEVTEKMKLDKNWTLQIFATDIDQEAVEKARKGYYPANIAADVSPERLRRFFAEDGQGFKVIKEIREMVIFAPQNVIMDPPFTKLDLLSCRNLLIYLTTELQKKLLPLFHYSLNPGGILLLGSAESLGISADLFAPIDSKARLYRRTDNGVKSELANFPATFISKAPVPVSEAPPRARLANVNIQVLLEQMVLQRFAPTAILTTDGGDIVFTSGRTGKYLEPTVGKPSLNLFAMAREGLRNELIMAFQKATLHEEAIKVRGIKVGTNGGSQYVDIMVQVLLEPEPLKGMVVSVITDVAEPQELKLSTRSVGSSLRQAKIEELERENAKYQTGMQMALADLQRTREEMQSSQEELKSANEELQSANEEMQSTNEELTTSKEEMQSMNEELQTVNFELRAKIEMLSRTESDMKNLLDSTDVATLFLEENSAIRRFTQAATKLFKLIPGDVGRPITDIVSGLVYPDLVDDMHEVLRTLVFVRKEVPTVDGGRVNVKIMPYRTQDNRIDGTVITFSEETVRTSALLERSGDREET